VGEKENRAGLRFPPDFIDLLSLGLLVPPDFPNWHTGVMITRTKDVIPIAEQMKWPADGICFDIEHNNFWMEEWEPRLEGAQQAGAR